MGTFLGQALKSGQGEGEWRRFFAVASASLAIVEKTSPVPGFDEHSPADVFDMVKVLATRLRILEKLRGFTIAADRITTERGHGAYHLVVLDSNTRTVRIKPYPISRLEQANLDYAAIEQQTKAGEPVEAVLVSAGPIDALRKAYPNYFLDTQEFIKQSEKVIAATQRRDPLSAIRKSRL